MVGESQRRANLERVRHSSKDGRKAIGEMNQPPAHVFIAGKFISVPGRVVSECFHVVVNKTAEPDVTEIHKLRVLDIPEIGRICKDGIQRARRNHGNG